jgi:hypothetical protein
VAPAGLHGGLGRPRRRRGACLEELGAWRGAEWPRSGAKSAPLCGHSHSLRPFALSAAIRSRGLYLFATLATDRSAAVRTLGAEGGRALSLFLDA